MNQASSSTRNDHASRGLLANVSVDDMRRRTETEPYRKLWQRLVAGWREMQRRASRDGAVGDGAVGSHSCTAGVVDAGLAWRLNGDRDALMYVESCIDLLAAAYWPDGPANFVRSRA